MVAHRAVVVCVLLAGVAAPAARAQEAHEATLVSAEGSDPYPVALRIDRGERGAIRGGSRYAADEQPAELTPFEAQRQEMDREACLALLGPDADCEGTAVPPPGLFDGARLPRAFTTEAVQAAGAEPEVAAETGGSTEAGPGTGASEEVAVGTQPGAEASPPASGGERDLSWLQGLALPDLPVHWTESVIWFLERYREEGSHRNTLIQWLKRSGRYAPMAREVFRRHGLPEDLLYVAAIESGYGPTERSSAGAVGVWQFMPAGGRIYGLAQNRWVDQRRNPELSTEAVALYFADLHDRFRSWDLALAAFNMGHAGLERVVLKYGCNDYWTLAATENALPYGTGFYVAKVLAIAVVARNLDRFGLADLELDEPRRYDVVEVRGVERVAALARAARISVEEFRALNPELLRDRTPPGEERWLVRVPAGTEEGFVARLGAAREEDQTRTYTVRFGETIADVAARFGTGAARLRRLNGLGADERVRGGDVLEVPDVEPRDLPPPAEAPVAVVPAETFVYPERQRLFYRVVPGDTLEGIAAGFSVTETDLASWNVIDPEAVLVPGLVLQIFAPPFVDRSAVLVLGESEATVYVAGSAALFEHLAAEEGKRRVVYVFEEGDTLESIAQRFRTTRTSLTRINRFGYDPDLQPGDEVVIWADPAAAEEYLRETGQGPDHVPVEARDLVQHGAPQVRDQRGDVDVDVDVDAGVQDEDQVQAASTPDGTGSGPDGGPPVAVVDSSMER
jgi:membrane-bound lytic murein transglycosylase D